jgi:hypothetical protein
MRQEDIVLDSRVIWIDTGEIGRVQSTWHIGTKLSSFIISFEDGVLERYPTDYLCRFERHP